MNTSVLDWLDAAAQRFGDRPAFGNDRETYTWAGISRLSRRIGTEIARRVAARRSVAVFMDKGPACIGAMLGALQAGCCYTPIDPAMPEMRVKTILGVLEPRLLVTDTAHWAKALALGAENCLNLDEISGETDDGLLSARRRDMIDTDLIYVLFTSGSTGTPKGVAIRHRGVIDFVDWACEELGYDGECRFGNQAPLYFDNSIMDIYCAMKTGAYVNFIPQKLFLFPGRMVDYLNRHEIDTIFWVPSALINMANSGILADKTPAHLKRVYFCGEVMPVKQLNIWRRALPAARYVNLYGPTEITDVCMYFPVEREFSGGEALPIGFPCKNTRVSLVNGEICVSGTCLAAGYYRAPELTKRAFVPDGTSPTGEIMYRTGDLGQYNERGEMMFLGRADSQIKRSGYRIELGEIESALLAGEHVDNGLCLYDAEKQEIICVYEGACETKALKAHLKQRLPKYMLPDRFVQMEALPRTGNGKLDRVKIRQDVIV